MSIRLASPPDYCEPSTVAHEAQSTESTGSSTAASIAVAMEQQPATNDSNPNNQPNRSNDPIKHGSA